MYCRGCSKDPGDLNAWLKSNGGYGSGCNIYWGSVDKLGYSTFVGKQDPTYSYTTEMCNGLAAGHGLIANVHNGGHWVLLTGCAGNNVFMSTIQDIPPPLTPDVISLTQLSLNPVPAKLPKTNHSVSS